MTSLCFVCRDGMNIFVWHFRYSTIYMSILPLLSMLPLSVTFFEFSFTWVSCQVGSSNCWLKFSPDGEWWSWMNKHLMVIAYCIFCKPCLRMQCFHMWLCIQAWQGLHQGLHIKPCTWSLLSLAELCRSPGICLVQIQLVIPRVTSVLSTFRSWCIPVSRLSNGMGGSKEGAHLQIWPWSALHT